MSDILLITSYFKKMPVNASLGFEKFNTYLMTKTSWFLIWFWFGGFFFIHTSFLHCSYSRHLKTKLYSCQQTLVNCNVTF